MGLIDNLRNTWNRLINSEYDDYYEEDYVQYEQNTYNNINMTSAAHDYSYYQQQSIPEQEEPSETNVYKIEKNDIVNEIALVKPSNVESVRDAADHLIKNRAVVLSLRDTEANLARRWLDYLGGVTYAVDGKINRIAPYTYLLTPKGVELVSGFESEA